MKYVNYDNEGEIIGFYDDKIHVNIPIPSKKISDTVWLELINNQGKYIVDTTLNIELAKVIEDLFVLAPVREPEPEEMSKFDELADYVTEVDFRVLMIEMGL